MLSRALLPVRRTFSALMTTTLSPQSTFGVKIGRCLPRRRSATMLARRPSTSPSASITTQSLRTSAGLILKVFMETYLSGTRACTDRLHRCQPKDTLYQDVKDEVL